MKIKTDHVHPPIPPRIYDWAAWDDDTYEAGAPIGWGETEQEAVSDLLEQLTLAE